MSKANELLEMLNEQNDMPLELKGKFQLVSVPKGLDKGPGSPGILIDQVGVFKTDEFGIIHFDVEKLKDTDRLAKGSTLKGTDTDFSVSGVGGKDLKVKSSGKKLFLFTDIAGAQGGAKWEFSKA